MKTATQFFSLMMIVFVVGVASETKAQERGHHHENQDRGNGRYGKHHHHDHWKDRRGDHHKHAKHHRHEHDHAHHRHVVHHHEGHHHHAPIVVRHERPRYVYYRDYDVYYDFDREVYITWSGRSWTMSASLPVALRRIDRHRAVRMEVDYVQDDFPRYLQTHKPVYTRIYTEF